MIEEVDTEGLFDDAEMVFALELKDTNVTDRFEELPQWLKEKYSPIVGKDLPPKSTVRHDIVEHEIEVKHNARLPRRQPYHTTPKLEREIDLIVADLLEKKFITPSKSPCSSPVVLVKKKDDTYRLCVDYRALN